MTREEAIETIKRNCTEGSQLREACAMFIPELKESEDERIRKNIIHILQVGGYMSPEEKDKAFAYLEKQKEHSMSAEEVLARAGLKPYKDGNQWCILAGDNIQEGICGFGDTIDEALYQFLIEVLEKPKKQEELPLMDGNTDLYFDEWNQQKQNPTKRQCFEEGIRYAQRLQKEQKPEEKPINWTELTWEDINELEDIINKVHYEFRNGIGQESFGKEVLEQFREYKGDEYLDGIEEKWSGEDNDYIDAIIAIINRETALYPKGGATESLNSDLITWLKALPERFNLQPKQEWSEDIIRKAVKEVGLTQHQIDWFKTNVFPPKQEWSKEDKIRLDSIISDYRELLQDYKVCHGVDYIPYTSDTFIRNVVDDVDFLESLLLQPHTISIKDATKFGNLEYERGVKDGIQSEKSRHWKPSKEQMGALNYAYCELFKREDVSHNVLGPLQNLIDILSKL